MQAAISVGTEKHSHDGHFLFVAPNQDHSLYRFDRHSGPEKKEPIIFMGHDRDASKRKNESSNNDDGISCYSYPSTCSSTVACSSSSSLSCAGSSSSSSSSCCRHGENKDLMQVLARSNDNVRVGLTRNVLEDIISLNQHAASIKKNEAFTNKTNSRNTSSIPTTIAHVNIIPVLTREDLVIDHHLGSGGFNHVYSVRLKRPLKQQQGQQHWRKKRSADKTRKHSCHAMKFVKDRQDFSTNVLHETGLADLTTEAQILSRVHRHPFIVDLCGVGRDFLLLERLDGGTLREKFQKWSKAEPPHINIRLRIASRLCAALVYLHSKQILYRDLKPSNVGFDRHGCVKLFDFGLAKQILGAPRQEKLTGMTGSKKYMAPEVALSLHYSYPADVYSFTILFWELLSLQRRRATARATYEDCASITTIITTTATTTSQHLDYDGHRERNYCHGEDDNEIYGVQEQRSPLSIIADCAAGGKEESIGSFSDDHYTHGTSVVMPNTFHSMIQLGRSEDPNTRPTMEEVQDTLKHALLASTMITTTTPSCIGNMLYSP